MENNLGYRYPGVIPFTTTQESVFLGRDSEINDLIHLIKLERIIVLNSESGLGKTSLLKAGLIPKLQLSGSKFFPIYSTFNDIKVDPKKELIDKIEKILYERSPKSSPEYFSLWEAFKGLEKYLNDFSQGDGKKISPILILDQFEQIFTVQTYEARSIFVSELAGIFSGSMPKRIKAILEAKLGEYDSLLEKSEKGGSENLKIEQEIDKLSNELKELETPPAFKLIVAIRSDFLSNLENLNKQIPGFLKARYKLNPLSRENAEKAILYPALRNGDFLSPKFDMTGISDELLDYLEGNTHDSMLFDEGHYTIEPFLLQLFSNYIEKKVIEQVEKKETRAIQTKLGDLHKIENDYLGGKEGMEEIQKNFYVNELNKISIVTQRNSAQELIEEMLIEGGVRVMQNEHRLLNKSSYSNQEKISKKTLATLIDSGLIRKENRNRINYYEISHDSLVKPILDTKLKRINDAEILRYKNEASEYKNEAAEAEANANRYLRLLRLTVLAAIVCLGFMIFSIISWKSLKNQKKKVKETSQRNIELKEEKFFADIYSQGQLGFYEDPTNGLKLSERGLKLLAHFKDSISDHMNRDNFIDSAFTYPSLLDSVISQNDFPDLGDGLPLYSRFLGSYLKNYYRGPHYSIISSSNIGVKLALDIPNHNKILAIYANSSPKIWAFGDRDSTKETSLIGHEKQVVHADVSKDGEYIITCSYDKQAIVWDNTGRLLHRLTKPNSAVMSAAFSDDGKFIVSASRDGNIALWNWENKNARPLLQKEWKHTPELRKSSYLDLRFLDFSPSSQHIVSAINDPYARVWDLDGNEIKKLVNKKHFKGIRQVKYSPKGNFVATCSDEKEINIWKIDGDEGNNKSYKKFQTIVLDDESNIISSISFSSNEKFLAAALDKEIKIWELYRSRFKEKTELEFLGHSGTITNLSFSGGYESEYLISTSWDNTIRKWSWNPEKTIEVGSGLIEKNYNNVVLSSEGILGINSSNKIIFFNGLGEKMETKGLKIQEDSKFLFVRNTSLGVLSNPDSSFILDYSINNDSLIFKTIKTIEGKYTPSILFSFYKNDDRFLIGIDKKNKNLDIRIIRGSHYWEPSFSDSLTQILDISSDGSFISTFKENKILCFSISGDSLSFEIPILDKKEINYLRFSKDQKILASASENSIAKLWNVDSLIDSYKTTKNKGLRLFGSPSNKTLTSEDKLDILKSLSENPKYYFCELNSHTSPINTIDLIGEGMSTLALTASNDDKFKLWDLSGKEIFSKKISFGNVDKAIFSLHGKSIISFSGNRIKYWPIDLHYLKEKVKQEF